MYNWILHCLFHANNLIHYFNKIMKAYSKMVPLKVIGGD